MGKPVITIAALNEMPADAFVAALAGVLDQTPWAAAVAGWRPFADVAELHEALAATVLASPHETRLEILRLAAGLDDVINMPGLGDSEIQMLRDLNRRFCDRFGFPFIIAMRQRNRDDLLAAFAQRWEMSAAGEEATALAELIAIGRERLDDLIVSANPSAGWLTVQVIDDNAGLPAQGIGVTLSRVADTGRRHRLIDVVTDAGGRPARPLLAGGGLAAGRYSIDVAVAAYFTARGVALGDPPFLDVATLGFGVADPNRHCHIVLTITPHGYSFHRGAS